MPVYQTRNGQVIDPETWMTNPDDQVYSCWQEFAKQLFWDFQMGEAFIMPMAYGSDGLPQRFRVLPPHLVNVELGRGGRVYSIGSNDLTGEILHIRYKSTISDARGHGPLESALPRLVNIELLQRYVGELAKTGGVPLYWMEIDRRITPSEGQDLLTTWAENRMRNIGQPALVGHGAKLNQARTMDAKEMGLLELSQFDESRLSVLLGVPPFLMGLAGASGSLTYSNIADLYDFHDRSSLRPKVRMVMESLSNWALPRGRSVELNRDDYTRLTIDKRYAAYAVGLREGFLDVDEVRAMERLGPMPQNAGRQTSAPTNNGRQDLTAAKALTGGTN
jgi:HK97 family phage portal protein